MKFIFAHNNLNVKDLEKSLSFYKTALGLCEAQRKQSEDGQFILVFLSDEETKHQLELTWLRDWDRPYNLGDNEFHMAFYTDNFENSYEMHKKMGCICFENKAMGVYFISDPDGYWTEIIPAKP